MTMTAPSPIPMRERLRMNYDWTPRQREVLDLMARGKTNTQIGEELGISLDGAKWHVSEILSKLQADQREEAAEYWRRYNGLAPRFGRLFRGAGGTISTKWVAGAAAAGVFAVSAVFALYLAGSFEDDHTDADVSEAASGCSDAYPFESIPCDLYQSGSARVAAVDRATADNVLVGEQQIRDRLTRMLPDAEILEVKLVYAWSAESSDPQRDRRVLWAASLRIPGGTYISSGALYGSAMQRIHPGGDFASMTAEERDQVATAVARDIQALRDSITQEYHVDFFDPYTGDYLGSSEGAR